MSETKFCIFSVSDATGGLAYKLAIAASEQFPNIQADVIRKMQVNTLEEIQKVVLEAKASHAVIIFTMVSHHTRRLLLSEAKDQGVVVMDVMGPVLDILSNYFHTLPSDEPGLQYKNARDYYKRTEALEFTVRHDEGLGLDSLDQADIVLLGLSRASKTPLSVYLAYRGYRCANVPVLKGQSLPPEVLEVDRKKIIGLTITPEQLMVRRSSRLKGLGRPDSELYAQEEHVKSEIEHMESLYQNELPGIFVTNVTGKAIEEIASEVIHYLSKSE